MAEGNLMASQDDTESLDDLSEKVRRCGVAEITRPNPVIDLEAIPPASEPFLNRTLERDGSKPYNNDSDEVPLLTNRWSALRIIAYIAVIIGTLVLVLSLLL